MKDTIKYILIILIALGISSCSKWDGEYQDFYAKYQIFGGFAAVNWTTVEIFEDGNVIYTGRGQNGLESYSGNISIAQRRSIYNTFMDNSFLDLDSSYFTYVVFDDIHEFLTLKTQTDSHRVIANQASIQNSILPWSRKFTAISDSMYQLVDLLRTNVEQGLVEVYRSYPVFQWPYQDRCPIVSDQSRWGLSVDPDIYAYVDSINEVFSYNSFSFVHEDSMIYRVIADTSNTLTIYYPFKPIRWLLDTKLSDIDEEGLIVYDEDFTNLRDKLHSSNFDYFYDSLTSSNALLYTILFTQGNYFGE